MEILWNFKGDFWKNLQRITTNYKNFIEKLQRNAKKILEIFALWKKCPWCFKALSSTENTANIFQNNILLVSSLTTYSIKTMLALLLAFLQCVCIKNTISLRKNFWYSHHDNDIYTRFCSVVKTLRQKNVVFVGGGCLNLLLVLYMTQREKLV